MKMRELLDLMEAPMGDDAPLQPGGRIHIGYHVTERALAADILRDGFWGGAGDVGLGVYLWKSLTKARAYAKAGGW